MPSRLRRVLLVTLPPQILGGVRTKTLFLARHLAASGHHVSLAYYAARSLRPELNVGVVPAVLGRQGDLDRFVDDDGFEHIVVGCRVPELEFTYTAASPVWQAAFEGFDRHLAVGGSSLIAHPLVQAGIPHILWCADDLEGDREARVGGMSVVRRLADKVLVQPFLDRQQQAVIDRTDVVRGVSTYTVSRLQRHASPSGTASGTRFGRMPIPVDLDRFVPGAPRDAGHRIGFAGRINDPRKNADLLIQTMAALDRRGVPATLAVAGPRAEEVEQRFRDAGIEGAVEFLGVLNRTELQRFYQDLDVLVLSSTREGLAIAGLEAMASGTPVVATRCGGPQDYVVEGETGHLTASTADALADGIGTILADAEHRAQRAQRCRQMVTKQFSEAAFSDCLDQAWTALWQESYRATDWQRPGS